MLSFISRNVLYDVRGGHQTIAFPLSKMSYLYRLDFPMELRNSFCRTHANNPPGLLVKYWAPAPLLVAPDHGAISMFWVACSQWMVFLCTTLINFSAGIFIDKMEKQIAVCLQFWKEIFKYYEWLPRTWFQCGIILVSFLISGPAILEFLVSLLNLGDRTSLGKVNSGF